MALSVSLRKVVDELDGLSTGWTAYLNRASGELFTIPGDEADVPDADTDPADLQDWEQEYVAKVREIEGSEDWLELPTSFDIHEWALMDSFSHMVEDAGLRDELLQAIRGRGAFRFFKNTIYRHGIEQAWYVYRTAPSSGSQSNGSTTMGLPTRAKATLLRQARRRTSTCTGASAPESSPIGQGRCAGLVMPGVMPLG
jgi:hypothetical protein